MRFIVDAISEEGVTIDDFMDHQRATFIDMVFLQQDAFDPVDVSTPIERQKGSFQLIQKLIRQEYPFTDKEKIREFFANLTGLYKNLNYAEWNSPEYNVLLQKIDQLQREAIKDGPAVEPASETRPDEVVG